MSNNPSIAWKEVDFEVWFRENPRLPDGRRLLIVGIHGAIRRMCDLIALDENGGLVIFEVKNESSNRKAIGQALEYLSLYESLDIKELADDFDEFTGRSLYADFFAAFGRHIERITPCRRVFLVAPRHDAYSAVCTDYLGRNLARGEIEFSLLEATTDAGAFRLKEVQLKPFRRLTALEKGFAVSPRAGRLFYVIQPGSEPIVWNVGRWNMTDASVTVRTKPSRKLLRRYRSHLLPLETEPSQVDLSATGSVWVRRCGKRNLKAIVIGQISAKDQGNPSKSCVAFAQFQDGQFQTFRRRPSDLFYSNWLRISDEPVLWSQIVDQADTLLSNRLKIATNKKSA